MILNNISRNGLLAFFWLLAITWLSTRGGISLPGFSLIATDKLAHACSYGLLVWLILLSAKHRSTSLFVGVWAFASLYGAFMEWIQYSYFPNRFFEVDDMLANAIGAALSAAVFAITHRKTKE